MYHVIISTKKLEFRLELKFELGNLIPLHVNQVVVLNPSCISAKHLRVNQYYSHMQGNPRLSPIS